MSNPREDMLEAMEQMKDFTAAISGIRSQLIEGGWSPENSEKLAAEIITRILRDKEPQK